MSLIKSLFTRVFLRQIPSKGFSASGSHQIEALIQAHGDWLALLATFLERERVITGAELARTPSEFADCRRSPYRVRDFLLLGLALE